MEDDSHSDDNFSTAPVATVAGPQANHSQIRVNAAGRALLEGESTVNLIHLTTQAEGHRFLRNRVQPSRCSAETGTTRQDAGLGQ